MRKEVKERLEAIAQKANELLQQWGIKDCFISVTERGEVKRSWGRKSWRRPALVFQYDGVEIGAYSDKARAIKVAISPTIWSRLYSACCRCNSPKVTLPFSVDFLLALQAFRYYLTGRYPSVYHTSMFVDLDGRLSLTAWTPKLRIDFYSDKTVLLDGSGRTILEGTPEEILLAVRKFYMLSCL